MMILPLIVMFATIFIMFIGWGFPTQNVPGSKIRIALTSGYLLATICIAIMVIVKKVMTFTEVVDTWVNGVKKMAGILAIIIAAWGVGSVCSQIGTSQFVVDSTIGFLSPALVPALLFLIGSVISFATGTSWGTMAILLPLGINMAYSFGVSEAITIAAVLSGSLFGDHCAPISDTTVMSSMAGGCNHIDHVRTQIPYALLAAISSFIAYLIVGVGQLGALVSLLIALVVMAVLFFCATKLFGKKIA
jgi:Na+/H+ antiporter NhaC